MSPATVIRRDKVTGAFLTKPGGYFAMDRRLFCVVSVPKGPNDRMLEVEDCWAPCDWPVLEMEREIVVKGGRVVRWPPGL